MPSIRHLDKTGGTIITNKQWADAVAGVLQTAEKFYVQNDGLRLIEDVLLSILEIVGNDGVNQFRIGADVATVIPPYGLEAIASDDGEGVFTPDTYGYVVTAINGTGETTQSFEATVVVPDATTIVTLTWTQVAGATGYKIYRTAVPGTYTTPALRATVGVTGTYIDDGDAVSAGAPPATNTTAGGAPNYGSPPPLGTSPLTIGDLAIGQSFVYWCNRIISAGTPESGNPRQVFLRFQEDI